CNRAAAHVHRLNADGYRRARGILRQYLRETRVTVPDLPWLDDENVNRIDKNISARQQFAKFRSYLDGVALALQRPRWRRVRFERLPGHFGEVMPDADNQEWLALLLQMESLFLLTRARPLREPGALRDLAVERDELHLESIGEVR